jgi:hypothetical protein
MITICDHVVSLLRAAKPHQTQGENTDHQYEVRNQTAIRHYGSVRNMPSRTSFSYGKRRSQNSYRKKYQGSDEMNLENSEIGYQWKNLVPSHYRRQRLHLPSYSSGILDARRDSRRENILSLDADPSKEQQNRTVPPGIKYKAEGTSLRSWKPIQRRKFLESLYSQTTTSSPKYAEEETLAYEGNRQDAEREGEALNRTSNFRNENDEVYDEEQYGINDVYASEIEESRKSNASYTGLQATHQPEDGGVQEILYEIPYSASIEDGTNSYTGESSYSSSEGETDESEGTESIHSRIERLKSRIRTQMIKEFGRKPRSNAPIIL